MILSLPATALPETSKLLNGRWNSLRLSCLFLQSVLKG
jgi:hypothetical protein